MSMEDHDLSPRVLHDREKDASLPEWVRMALRQREAEVAERKRKADELAAIEEHEVSGDAWLAVFRAQAKDTRMEQERYDDSRRGIDRRLHGADLP